ncbi:MAG: Fe-S cluster assembly sulfur transfer protein SufU, partial [Chordicoccus sp.]
MDLKQMYREIVNEHNLHPTHKHDMENPTMVLRGVNPSCGDDISLKLKVEDGVIKDGSFVGSGCAISQASADMMLDLVIGKSEDEAKRLADIF